MIVPLTPDGLGFETALARLLNQRRPGLARLLNQRRPALARLLDQLTMGASR